MEKKKRAGWLSVQLVDSRARTRKCVKGGNCFLLLPICSTTLKIIETRAIARPKIARAVGPDGPNGVGLRHIALRRVASALIVAVRRREILGGEDDSAVSFVASRRAATYANSTYRPRRPTAAASQ